MNQFKLTAGQLFPEISVNNMQDETIKLGPPKNGADWQMVVVYRGRHCPLCTKFLNQLESFREKLLETGVDLVAVSADSKTQAEDQLEKLEINYPIAYGLTLEQMKTLGVYISHPRSPQETDHPFSEPAIFVINQDKNLHVVDYSNNPFVRPELESLVNGLKWIRDPENDYPIRGTFE